MQEEEINSYYKYTPSKTFALVPIIIFAVITTVLCVQIFIARRQTKTQFRRIHDHDGSYVASKQEKKELRFVTSGIYIPLIIGGLLEVGGYIARIISTNHVDNIGPYVAQAVLIIVAPGMISGTLYMQFHEYVRFLNCPSNSGVSFFIKDSVMVKLFVAGDVISFFLQAAGGGLSSQTSTQKTGENLVVIGLFVQLVSFGIFLFLQVNFSIRYSKYSVGKYCNTIDKKWLIMNYCMIGSSVCILIRSIVRTIEFIEGWYGYLSNHEVYLFVFDAIVMFFAMVFISIPFFFVHLGKLYFWYCSFTNGTSQKEERFDEFDEEFERAVL